MKTTIVAGLALALLATPGAAQLTGKQADAQLRALAKQVRKGHAAAMKDRVATLDAAIDAFVAAATTGGAGEPFADLFDALVDFEVDLYSDFVFAYTLLNGDAILLLDEYAGATELVGVYPQEFYFGTGRALDDLRTALLAEQSKALAKARKLLEKAATKVAKAGPARLAFFLGPPTTDGRTFFNQGLYGGQTRDPLVLCAVLTLGFVDSADSGQVLAAGFGSDAQAVSVRAIGPGLLVTEDATFPEPGSPFWTVALGGGGTLPDGNWYVVAWQDSDGTSEGAAVSIR